MSRKIWKAVFSSMVLLSLAACGQQPGSPEGSSTQQQPQTGSGEQKPKIYVVLKTLNSEYFQFIEAGAKAAFQDFNVDGTIMAPSNQTQVMEQVNMIEDLLNKNPDGLVLTPSQPVAVVSALAKYKAKDIPVVLLDSDVDWEDKTTFIGNDDALSGQKAGETLAAKLSRGDKVAILEGISGTPTSAKRVQGAREALEQAGMIVAASEAANWDRVEAVSVMENVLQAHPDIKGVVAANDEMALGAIRASEAKGKDIAVVGMDGIIEAIESIQKGSMDASIAVKTYDMGYKGVENAVKAIRKETVPKQIVTEIDVITPDNAEAKLAQAKGLLGK
ncbi:sugar ABC transporter substrate-binding protein [Brevibacillus agri]|uniref:sugar ABC transporter substrate-binding protein n=1 Tax=Brevibacillus TaxID=55080 RepID=UPI00047131F7|nr:sugar ABC transporter substrate-binding protein [Brevibacillus agri]MBY0052169.1 sugar ABC transporter substrate-binding protein [Brevibacillus agri]MCG5252219.1 sugar ABC transporter substrate-binding protein [Brevibacillus agri]MDN4093943.1 sugar ABC transporter substrate-binding protein [Brevibacillus agri]MED1645402.1 sugar ABC transporter substrate-binding protein [Brevibacillus agri]MED1655207.1 sugar ABC transporter substrate-binding protein [Brevibacillus agri]